MELTRSEPAVAPAPKMAALPSFSPSFLAHAPCCERALLALEVSPIVDFVLLTLGCCGLAG